MEKKINIAELLKECPRGMELNCLTFNNVFFQELDWSTLFPIICYRINNGIKEYMCLTEFGSHFTDDDAKCIIFPKGKTTWDGFVPPCKFKDGDIIYVKDKYNQEWCSILSNDVDDKLYTYVDFYINYNIFYHNKPNVLCEHKYIIEYRLATEKEKEKLFKAIKDNGYQWNPETKTLEKLIEPKFKVGNRIKSVITSCYYTVVDIKNNNYFIKSDSEKYPYQVSFELERYYELVPAKFDINTLIPFESRVLVRDNDYDEWKSAFWSHLRQKADIKYDTIRGAYRQCIPYNDDTKHLLGKTNSCNDYYKIWE